VVLRQYIFIYKQEYAQKYEKPPFLCSWWHQW